MTGQPTEQIANTVLSIDAWLETMRQPGGYGGPVTHRWQDSLIYTGPGIDWRYEGIISGYLHLFKATNDQKWLTKAVLAGMDILNSLGKDGTYPASSFEINPTPGGTPHEAACDLALLQLAVVLKEQGDSAWVTVVHTARKNLKEYHLGVLWNSEKSYFYNQTHDPNFVPNKAATICEALFALADFDNSPRLVEKYIQPTLQKIITCQLIAPGHPLNGAIDQSTLDGVTSGRFFPFYNARCIPALIKAYKITHDDQYLQSAKAAMDFIIRFHNPDGSFPQLIYTNSRQTAYPQWIAGVGDILRAAALLVPFRLSWPTLELTQAWLLDGLLPSGGIRSAHGFALLESRRHALPDYRDILPVCGWVDKAFCYLAGCLPKGTELGAPTVQETTIPCAYLGWPAEYHETNQLIEVTLNHQPVYRWKKTQPWAEIF